jgi:glycosyltransferase involved in cell wall biosynthesis
MSPTFPVLCAREIRRHDRVLLHTPFPGPDLIFLGAAHDHTRLFIWWHSDIVRQRAVLPLYRPILRRALARASGIFVAHRRHVDTSDVLGEFREKCMVVPYAIDVRTFRPEPGDQEAAALLRSSYADDRPFALFVGRLVYYKGIDVLLRAVPLTDVGVAIVGTGALERPMRDLARELGIDRRVVFLGEVSEPELRLLYQASDFLVLPSVANSEAFGLVQLEAMAASRPVINTALPTAVPEISVHEETGLTVAPGDPVALAEAMNRLAFDATLRSELGRRARERVEREYSQERMVERLAAVIYSS